MIKTFTVLNRFKNKLFVAWKALFSKFVQKYFRNSWFEKVYLSTFFVFIDSRKFTLLHFLYLLICESFSHDSFSGYSTQYLYGISLWKNVIEDFSLPNLRRHSAIAVVKPSYSKFMTTNFCRQRFFSNC